MSKLKTREIWFSSDSHINHSRMCEIREGEDKPYRPFTNVDEMNDCLITNWNETVKPGDSVFHGGDVCFQPATSEHLVAKLHGKKRLALGNHDRITSKTWLQNYFFEINMWYTFPDEGFMLSHVPLRLEELRADTILSVHGHNHRGRETDPHYMNICVENWNYKPIHMDEILQRVRILKEIKEDPTACYSIWPVEEKHPVLVGE